MGPYMLPIPVGASIAMVSSMAVAFVVTPWAAARWLRVSAGDGSEVVRGRTQPVIDALRRRWRWVEERAWSARLLRMAEALAHRRRHDEESRLTREYRRMMSLLLGRRRNRWLFLSGTLVLLVAATLLFPANLVRVKMLPFDNKNEFQVILDMPEGTPLERTAAVAREMAGTITHMEHVKDVELYAGTAAPFNFNGLIRHYYLRHGATVADLQVNLIDRHLRSEQSHEIAKRVRLAVEPIARRYGAKLKVAEVPPGPPVQQTLVAEVYGPEEAGRIKLVREIESIFRGTDGVVDVDNCLNHPQRKLLFDIDSERASLNHIDPEMCSNNLAIGLNGRVAGLLHDPREREQVDIKVQLSEAERSSVDNILSLPVRGRDMRFIPLGEMMHVEESVIDPKITHKNLLPASYVLADVAGSIESPAFAIQRMWDKINALRPNGGDDPGLDIYFTRQPSNDSRYAIKWDGEMHVTYEVFRDLGLALAAALVLIYVLMVGWFNSYRTPLIIMAVIPCSLIGILPAHALMGSFFSATSMIGFIAGAGIVVRNSIILVDFIKLRMAQGMALREAVIDAGAVRFRPMLLTASAVVVGSSVILFDPIFQGMAISLMAGEIAALFISRAAVPLLYYMAYSTRD
jgi:multidrug efflux pump subunit AcrB